MSPMSVVLSASVLPVLSDSKRARFVASLSIRSAIRLRSLARSLWVVRRHGPSSKALRAAAMARRVSSRVASAAAAIAASSIGLRI